MSGYLEALYGAAPLLAELGAGEVRLHGGTSGDQKFFVAWGFVEVLPERVTILAETAMHPNEIDRAEAEQELQEGREALGGGRRRRQEVRRSQRPHAPGRGKDRLSRRQEHLTASSNQRSRRHGRPFVVSVEKTEKIVEKTGFFVVRKTPLNPPRFTTHFTTNSPQKHHLLHPTFPKTPLKNNKTPARTRVSFFS